MISRLHKRRRAAVSELQITAFMNLMVVLVPFLLITAVFSQMTVIDLALPTPTEASDSDAPRQDLRVEIRESGLVLFEGNRQLDEFSRGDAALDVASLSERLAEIKEQRPDEERIMLLLEPSVSYDDLVQVMDAVRKAPGTRKDMFPGIAIGDAP